MKSIFIIFSVILLGCLSTVQCRGVNGGMSCAVCTVVMGIAMQVAEMHKESLVNATTRLCNLLPDYAQNECLQVTSTIELIVPNLSTTVTPDLFCLTYGTCTVDIGESLCHLFPLPFLENGVSPLVEKSKTNRDSFPPRIDVCKLPVLSDVCKILSNSFHSLEAAADFDEDGFSAFRGTDWKGRDCRDTDPNAYPGRAPYGLDILDDSNCNGIWGVDNQTNKPWEEILCLNSNPKGLIYIGDSIGAHFHMPQPGLNATNIILNELDWPQYGFATGHLSIPANILIKGLFYVNFSAKDTTNHMTDPKIFRENVMNALYVLNTKLPKNSHVVLIGLVYADFIYEAMAEIVHPIGILHDNVRYKDVYNWFNCMQIGPCTGWLNSNETLRKFASQTLHKTKKFEFFDLHFVKNPINAMMENSMNIPDLIESVDSLHPNQRAQPIMAETVWTSFLDDLPADVLGPVNKQNKLIKELFGNQGGH
ncbi:hypothetical protein NQ314_001257 [Rhamnusium bicolor]|uniref:Saposin B-type domain-containing protein n=1 Tax=Rhamnusium bicolor TaxID=1586634 RepID=A0AAV8ZSQ4_9CUCU|nr:hypothetical protein NQ314_001257 [Rhamnusium bicolor]